MSRQGWKEDFHRVRTILARGPTEATPLMETSKHCPNYALRSIIYSGSDRSSIAERKAKFIKMHFKEAP